MNTARLGRTNVEVSTVGLGTWAFGGPKKVHGRPVGWYGAEEGRVYKSLLTAAREGVNHWDTADVYGDGRAETLIGKALKDVSRDKLFLASKVGWSAGPHSHYYHPQQIRKQLERSLTLLGTNHLDLYYLHHCDFGPNDEYFDDAVALIQAFRDEGKIRFVGLSDWKTEKIRHYAELIRPDVVQCYRNVVDDTYESSGLKEWVEANDVGTVFFSPLKHGLLLGIFEGPVTFGEGDHRNALQDFRDLGLLMRLRSCRAEMIGRFAEHPEPVLHGLLGALLADSPTGCCLVGLHHARHVKAATTAGERLSGEDARWVRQLYRENGRPTQASWKSYQEAGP